MFHFCLYYTVFLVEKVRKLLYQDQLLLNAGQKYCRMLQRKHSALLSTFVKLPFVIKIFVLSIFEWPFYTRFTVCHKYQNGMCLPNSVYLTDHTLLASPELLVCMCGFSYTIIV